ncbi:conserved hypothetical protein [Histoplasma mississippiense (nom. inval.)]|uniref:conserved hypothetical protein n=1 Tax=Ajellomyces capsulatus (strain NAm1 / WU24) TaxID=2059318 RepID=UPI000157C2B5|nr:conserved hypothetical protein [Histoplasma mississippiense (nom. inval.)]EDN07870.1 conserved hypothetical protein [Histoplasma mississippiense (nom. inval.)]
MGKMINPIKAWLTPVFSTRYSMLWTSNSAQTATRPVDTTRRVTEAVQDKRNDPLVSVSSPLGFWDGVMRDLQAARKRIRTPQTTFIVMGTALAAGGTHGRRLCGAQLWPVCKNSRKNRAGRQAAYSERSSCSCWLGKIGDISDKVNLPSDPQNPEKWVG